jgi:hypothetical protein
LLAVNPPGHAPFYLGGRTNCDSSKLESQEMEDRGIGVVIIFPLPILLFLFLKYNMK